MKKFVVQFRMNGRKINSITFVVLSLLGPTVIIVSLCFRCRLFSLTFLLSGSFALTAGG